MQRSVLEAPFDQVVVHVGLFTLGLETDDRGEPVRGGILIGQLSGGDCFMIG